ncbi:MAG: hypothetical protein K0U78_16355 [Actinomycetia bacterium]|nr:hypothetical protein [Actinomycetes bacterium]
MWSATLQFSSEQPSPAAVAALTRALALDNAAWYLQEWNAGRDPECCSKCFGLCHRAQPARARPSFRGIADVVKSGYGNCAELTAIDAGHEIAEMLKEGYRLEDTLTAVDFNAELSSDPHGGMSPYFHVTYDGPDGFKDPTKKVSPC